MITPNERKVIELVKEARAMKIEVMGKEDVLDLRFSSLQLTKKLAHDIAIAIQDFFNNQDKNDKDGSIYS